MKKENTFVKKIIATLLILCVMSSLGSVNVGAAELDNGPIQPIVIGEFDGLLSECYNADIPVLLSTANVYVSSTATYDKSNGIKVSVKLYVPVLEFPKPKFTGMSGLVSISMKNKITNKSFSKSANGESTISSNVNTGVKGNSGDSGTISVSGVATATNALNGGGNFALSYEVKLP